MSSSSSSSSGSGGIGGVLFVVFLVLKLTGNIGWSWWWVTAPLWIGFGIWLVMLVLISLFAAGFILVHAKSRRF